MCGRYTLITDPETLRRLFGYVDLPNFPPRYNIAPTQPIAIVRQWEGQRQFALVRWGFIPAWVRDPKAFSLLMNARGETLLEKPAFRNAVRYRRCLIPADGFYGWKVEGASRRPYYARLKSHAPFAFAGLWEAWCGPNGEEMETAVIVTTAANPALRPVHERMPAILEQDAFEPWLNDRQVDAPEAMGLIASMPADKMDVYEVSPAVGPVANDRAELIEPYSAPADAATDAAKPRIAKPRARKDDGQASLL